MNSSTDKQPAEKLWHYMTLEKFLWLLHEKRPYFRRLSKLREADKREGMFPCWLQSLVARAQERMKKEPRDVRNDAESEAERSYVFCWNKDECESWLMWAAYGDNGRGVCLQTTINKLFPTTTPTAITCGPEHSLFYRCEVDYIRHNDQSSENEIYERYGHILEKSPISLAQFKSREFKWEDELRMVTSELRHDRFDRDVPLKDGVHVRFNEGPNDGPQFHQMIERVIAGPTMNPKTFAYLKPLVSRDFPTTFEQSTMTEDFSSLMAAPSSSSLIAG